MTYAGDIEAALTALDATDDEEFADEGSYLIAIDYWSEIAGQLGQHRSEQCNAPDSCAFRTRW